MMTSGPISLLEAMGVKGKSGYKAPHYGRKGAHGGSSKRPSGPSSEAILTEQLGTAAPDSLRVRRALKSFVRVDGPTRGRATEAEKEIAKITGGEWIGNRLSLRFDVRDKDARGRRIYIEVRTLQTRKEDHFWTHYKDGKEKDDKAIKEKARAFGVLIDLRDGKHDYYVYEADYSGDRWLMRDGKHVEKKYGEWLKKRKFGFCRKELDMMQKVSKRELGLMFAKIKARRA